MQEPELAVQEMQLVRGNDRPIDCSKQARLREKSADAPFELGGLHFTRCEQEEKAKDPLINQNPKPVTIGLLRLCHIDPSPRPSLSAMVPRRSDRCASIRLCLAGATCCHLFIALVNSTHHDSLLFLGRGILAEKAGFCQSKILQRKFPFFVPF